jgi:hypothetical protein
MISMSVTIDAIVCYHNHGNTLLDCYASIEQQVRNVLIVDDGSNYPPPQAKVDDSLAIFTRSPRHGVANSFNYGAFHSNADWLLYVDPHCIFAPEAVEVMLKTAGDDYDFCWGTGWVTFLTPDTPWAKLLVKNDLHSDVRLCFMMKRTLWEYLNGIPEPPHCHMDVLTDALLEQGIMVAEVHGLCHHHTDGGLMDKVAYYYTTGKSYGKLAKAGFPAGTRTPSVQLAKTYGRDHLAQMLSALFSCAEQIGAMEGLGKLPKKPLDMVSVGLSWEEAK